MQLVTKFYELYGAPINWTTTGLKPFVNHLNELRGLNYRITTPLHYILDQNKSDKPIGNCQITKKRASIGFKFNGRGEQCL